MTIKEACRSTHGVQGAFENAVEKLRTEYLEAVERDPRATFVLTLGVEQPRDERS